MTNKEFQILRAWLVEGWSQAQIDRKILKREDCDDSEVRECWKVINGKFGLTEDYKSMFDFTLDYDLLDMDDLEMAFAAVSHSLADDIPIPVKAILGEFWQKYVRSRPCLAA